MTINEDKDICVICGAQHNLNDMWVLVKTKKSAANICFVCKEIYDKSIKDFSALVYNNKGLIQKRVSKDVYGVMMGKFKVFRRMGRLINRFNK